MPSEVESKIQNAVSSLSNFFKLKECDEFINIQSKILERIDKIKAENKKITEENKIGEESIVKTSINVVINPSNTLAVML